MPNPLKSAKHHWWPQSVSERWTGADGCTGWVLPTGEVRRMPPDNFGAIGNGHHLKFGKGAEATPWDQTFEDEFQHVDNLFGEMLDWLASLTSDANTEQELSKRFVPQALDEQRFSQIVEGLVSLVVRSPSTRESAVALAEDLRGPLKGRERSTLIGLNIRGRHRALTESLGKRGKLVVLYSPDREFIFGDGFFHNISPSPETLHNPRMVVPLTPGIAAVYTRPISYLTNPRMMTLVLRPEETGNINDSVQVYARSALFYRSEPPLLLDAFRSATHFRYATTNNPVDQLLDSIPGVLPRRRLMTMISSW